MSTSETYNRLLKLKGHYDFAKPTAIIDQDSNCLAVSVEPGSFGTNRVWVADLPPLSQETLDYLRERYGLPKIRR